DDEPGAFAHCFQVWAGDAEEPGPLPGDGAQVEGAYPDLVVVAGAGDPTPTRQLFEQSMDGSSREQGRAGDMGRVDGAHGGDGDEERMDTVEEAVDGWVRGWS